jgi:DNA polymerase-3 subunit alpha
MRILNRLGGIELAKAYTCIKAISKKKEALIEANHEKFVEGATANGLTAKDAEDIWGLIVKFAGYGFNKSHSTAYALIAYQTAYLKTHYPVEFMAALLSGDIPGRNFKRKDLLVEHMEDCERMGIEIVNPDVNSSDVDFSVADDKIYFALSAIKGCGGSAAEAIVAARSKEGRFHDLFDFCERVDAASCNRATIETLIKAGTMDGFGARRSQLLASIDRAMQSGAAALADRRTGQRSLFGDLQPEEAKPAIHLPDLPELDERERLMMEREVLGFYRSSHPLAEFEEKLAQFCTHTTADISHLPERAEVILGGMLASIKLAHVKKVRPGVTATKYANFDLEDKSGAIRCILWPDDFVTFGELVQADSVLAVRGVIDRRSGDEANLIVNELIPLDQIDSRYTSGLVICVDERNADSGTLKTLHEIIRGYPGDRDLFFLFSLADGSRVQLKSQRLKIDIHAELRRRVDDLLGPGHTRSVMSPPATNGGQRTGRRNKNVARPA